MAVFDFDLFQINAPLGFQLMANIIKYFRFYCDDCVYRSTLCMHSHFSTIRSCWMMETASYFLAWPLCLFKWNSWRQFIIDITQKIESIHTVQTFLVILNRPLKKKLITFYVTNESAFYNTKGIVIKQRGTWICLLRYVACKNHFTGSCFRNYTEK